MIQKKRKKTIAVLFIFLIFVVILGNISFSNDIKIYFANEQNGMEQNEDLYENEYSVDIYAETTEKTICGFQFQLIYPENIELIEIVNDNFDQVNMNSYRKRIAGYKKNNNNSTIGKVKLCTLIFEIIEKNEDNSYDVKIDYSNKYSKVIDENGKKIDIQNYNEIDKNANNNETNSPENKSIEINENSSSKNTGDDTIENISLNQSNKNNEIILIEDKGTIENNVVEKIIIPYTGEEFDIIVMGMILIGSTLVLGITVLKYKNKM